MMSSNRIVLHHGGSPELHATRSYSVNAVKRGYESLRNADGSPSDVSPMVHPPLRVTDISARPLYS
jgi:hypothetical protein